MAEKLQNILQSMPRQLPTVRYEGKSWFFDERLRQLRNIKDPNDFQDLNDFEVEFFKRYQGQLPPAWAKWEVVYDVPDEAVQKSKFFKTRQEAEKWARENEDDVMGMYRVD